MIAVLTVVGVALRPVIDAVELPSLQDEERIVTASAMTAEEYRL